MEANKELKQKSEELDKIIALAKQSIEIAEEQKKEIDELMKSTSLTKRTPEQAFVQLVESCNQIFMSDTECPQLTYLMKDGKVMFGIDSENQCFIFNYDRVLSVFENEFGMNYEQIKVFIKKQVEERFKLMGFKAVGLQYYFFYSSEERFKLMRCTPNIHSS